MRIIRARAHHCVTFVVCLALLLLALTCPAEAELQKYDSDVLNYSNATSLRDTEMRGQFLTAIEKSFFETHVSLWEKNKMTEKLAAAVQRAMKKHLGEHGFISSLQVAFDMNNVTQNIQKDVPLEFSEEYARFVEQLEDAFAVAYMNELRAYDRALQATRIGALTTLPAVRVFFEEQLESAELKNQLVMADSSVKDQTSQPNFSLGGTAAVIGVAIGKKILQKTLARKAVSTLGSGLGKKLLGVATGVGTAISIAWLAYDIGSFGMEVWNSPLELENAFVKHYDKHYSAECPKALWHELKEGVGAELDDIRERMNRWDDDTKAIIASPGFREQTAGMSEQQQKHYIDMLIMVRPLDNTVSYTTIAENFGPLLAAMEQEDVSAVRGMMAYGDLLVMRQWSSLAGRKFCDLFQLLPGAVWKSYPPNAESLETLNWMASQNASLREGLANFSPERARWIMRELPENELPRLFVPQCSQAERESELDRMASLPKKEHRKVWQSQLEYHWHAWSRYVGNTLMLLVGAIAGLSVWRRPRCERG